MPGFVSAAVARGRDHYKRILDREKRLYRAVRDPRIAETFAAELAERYGICSSTASHLKKRITLANRLSMIDAYKARVETAQRQYAISVDPELGSKTDREIGEKYDAGPPFVRNVRIRLGIRCRSPQSRTYVFDIMAAHESGDVDLTSMCSSEVLKALSLPCTVNVVSNARKRLGIRYEPAHGWRPRKNRGYLSNEKNNQLLQGWLR
jgi:hypothetical protein